MAPIPKRRKKKSPVILAAPVPVLLAAAPAPVPHIAAPATILLLPAEVLAPVLVVGRMAPPPKPVPLILVVAVGRLLRQGRQLRRRRQSQSICSAFPLRLLGRRWAARVVCARSRRCVARCWRRTWWCASIIYSWWCRGKTRQFGWQTGSIAATLALSLATWWGMQGGMMWPWRRSPVFLVEILRTATWQSVPCFLRTQGLALRQSSLSCRGESEM